jgi:hypothetical protein
VPGAAGPAARKMVEGEWNGKEGVGTRARAVRRGNACCATCTLAVLACLVGGGGREQVEMEGGEPPRDIHVGFAAHAPAQRISQLGVRQALASAERFSQSIAGLTKTQLPGTSMCAKKDFIIAKFDQLLQRLGADSEILNITDLATERAYADAMQAWLDTESVYRLAQQQHKESKEAAKFALNKLEVEIKVHKLKKVTVAEFVKVYPVKKKEIDSEREMILELIKMVEELAGPPKEGGGAAAAKSPSTTLSAIQQRLDKLAKVAGGPAGSMTLQKGLKEIEEKIMKQYSGQPFSKLKVSKEEMDETKNEVKKVLLDLLQDPDFRALILKMGLMNMLASLTAEEQVLQDDEETVAKLEKNKDEAKHNEETTDLERGPAEGEKTTREEEYTDEHNVFMRTIGPVDREIFIIKKIKRKITEYCEPGTDAKISKWIATLKTKPVSLSPSLPVMHTKSTLECVFDAVVRERGCKVEIGGFAVLFSLRVQPPLMLFGG